MAIFLLFSALLGLFSALDSGIGGIFGACGGTLQAALRPTSSSAIPLFREGILVRFEGLFCCSAAGFDQVFASSVGGSLCFPLGECILRAVKGLGLVNCKGVFAEVFLCSFDGSSLC